MQAERKYLDQLIVCLSKTLGVIVSSVFQQGAIIYIYVRLQHFSCFMSRKQSVEFYVCTHTMTKTLLPVELDDGETEINIYNSTVGDKQFVLPFILSFSAEHIHVHTFQFKFT